MKTYPFDSIERFSKFSESRNIKKLICGKNWQVFDEPESTCESYSFMANGTVMIAHGDNKLKCNWELNNKTKVLALSGKNSTHLFQIIFFDKTMMVLKADGDNMYSFFINKNNDKFFAPRFYTDIVQYFKKMAHGADIEAEYATQDEQEDFEELQDNAAAPPEQQKLQEDAFEMYEEINERHRRIGNIVMLSLFAIVYASVFVYSLVQQNRSLADCIIDAFLYGSIINLFVGLMCINKIVTKILDVISVKSWKNSHPNDPRNPYL